MSHRSRKDNKKFDTIVATIGLLLGLSMFFFILFKSGESKGIGLAFTLIASCSTYLFIRKRTSLTVKTINRVKLSPILTNILFAALFAGSTFLLFINVYHRPLLYFILISLMSAITAMEILTLSQGRNNIFLYSALLKILLISANIRLSAYFMFPSLLGWDTFYHADFIKSTLENCAVPVGQGYSSFPIMHLEVAIFMLLSSLSSLKEALYFSISFFELVSLLYIFLIGRSLLNVKAGLLAALLLGLSDHHILYAHQPIPMTLGLGFFPLIIYLTLNRKKTEKAYAILLLLFMVSILTHTIASFIVLVVLITMFLGEKLYPPLLNGRTKRITGATIAVLFFVSLMSYWIYASNFFTQNLLELYSDLRHIQILGLPYGSAAFSRFYTLFEYEMNCTGMYILYWLAGIGLLNWLSSQKKNQLRFMLIASVVILFVVPYGSLFLALDTIIPERWFPFIYVFSVILAAQGLSSLLKLFRKTSQVYASTLLIIFFFSIFMITSSTVNFDNSIFAKKSVIRYAFLKSEMDAANTLDSLYTGKITTDIYYGTTYFNYTLKRTTQHIVLNMMKGHVPIHGMIVIRKWTYDNPVAILTPGQFYSSIITTLGDSFRKKLESSMNKVYDNGGAEAYSSIYE